MPRSHARASSRCGVLPVRRSQICGAEGDGEPLAPMCSCCAAWSMTSSCSPGSKPARCGSSASRWISPSWPMVPQRRSPPSPHGSTSRSSSRPRGRAGARRCQGPGPRRRGLPRTGDRARTGRGPRWPPLDRARPRSDGRLRDTRPASYRHSVAAPDVSSHLPIAVARLRTRSAMTGVPDVPRRR
jgi:hypothetical protein